MENLEKSNNGGSDRCTRLKNNHSNNGDDRLSSLPDAILINILSLLSIDSAAATSVLSRRWRHLWTAITDLEFSSESSAFVDCVFGQLTSPKLSSFTVIIKLVAYNWESIFAHLCHRNVEEIKYIPNLKHLDVSKIWFESVEQMDWCAPEFVPECLLSKLKIIKIKVLIENDKELKLLEFILNNAIVLEELHIHCKHYHTRKESQLWNEYKFCEALFKLSKSSSTCKVLFEGDFINASRNDFKNGVLACQVRYVE